MTPSKLLSILGSTIALVVSTSDIGLFLHNNLLAAVAQKNYLDINKSAYVV